MLSARLVRGATWLLAIGVAGVRLVLAPAGAAAPKAMPAAGRTCAFQDASASGTSAAQLRAGVVCLVNLARQARGLPWLREQSSLNLAAQRHSNEMVADGSFSHTAGGSDPGTRLDRAGFRWSALGEAISTGYQTPMQTFRAWLASTDHCRILLSPTYRDIGIGVDRRPVRGYANRPGTWTADLALPADRRSLSGNWRAADGCPY